MAAAASKVDGHDKVIATAQQIVKSLATSPSSAEDMIRILAGFDHRLSSIHDLDLDLDLDFDSSDLASRLESAEKVILRWENDDSLLFEAPADDAAAFLAAVDEIAALAGLSADPRGRPDAALQIAMARLEDEFRCLVVRNIVPLDTDGLESSIRRISLSDADFEISADDDPSDPDLDGRAAAVSPPSDVRSSADLIHPEAVHDLKEIADRMIFSGYGKELRQVYVSIRRDVLDECLSILGVERMSIEEVQRMEWKNLNDKMKKWIQQLKVVVRVLLLGEKRLCDQIFVSTDELREECFAEIAKGCILQLLQFGDAISICNRSAEKLFRILDMYEALAGVVPELQELFPGESRELICGEVEGILKRLGGAVRGTLVEFGKAVRKESSRKPVQGGEIHPLSRYVMNYVKLLVDYGGLLDLLLDDDEEVHVEGGENDDGQCLGAVTPLGRRLVLLISYLEENVEEKAKLYEDGALQYVFLMNNILYIVQKVKDSELGKLLGDQWIRKRRGQIRQYATAYLRASWTKVLSYLKDDGFGGSGSGSFGSTSRAILKERFKSFNLGFEEIHRNQTTWKVPDPQLREELKISISEKVIPAYRAFLGRFGNQLEGEKNVARYIKYTADDLENLVSDFFEGLPGLSNHPRRKA